MFLVGAAFLGVVRTALVVLQAWLIATVVAGAFVSGKNLADLRRAMGLLLAVVAVRAVVTWSADVIASRGSANAKSSLRRALAQRSSQLGSDGRSVGRTGEIAALATRGIDALDGYFARYLPQILLAVVAP